MRFFLYPRGSLIGRTLGCSCMTVCLTAARRSRARPPRRPERPTIVSGIEAVQSCSWTRMHQYPIVGRFCLLPANLGSGTFLFGLQLMNPKRKFFVKGPELEFQDLNFIGYQTFSHGRNARCCSVSNSVSFCIIYQVPTCVCRCGRLLLSLVNGAL